MYSLTEFSRKSYLCCGRYSVSWWRWYAFCTKTTNISILTIRDSLWSYHVTANLYKISFKSSIATENLIKLEKIRLWLTVPNFNMASAFERIANSCLEGGGWIGSKMTSISDVASREIKGFPKIFSTLFSSSFPYIVFYLVTIMKSIITIIIASNLNLTKAHNFVTLNNFDTHTPNTSTLFKIFLYITWPQSSQNGRINLIFMLCDYSSGSRGAKGAMASPVPDKDYLLCTSWHFLIKNPLDC